MQVPRSKKQQHLFLLHPEKEEKSELNVVKKAEVIPMWVKIQTKFKFSSPTRPNLLHAGSHQSNRGEKEASLKWMAQSLSLKIQTD